MAMETALPKPFLNLAHAVPLLQSSEFQNIFRDLSPSLTNQNLLPPFHHRYRLLMAESGKSLSVHRIDSRQNQMH